MIVAALPAAHGLLSLPQVATVDQARERGFPLVLDYFPEGLGLLRTGARERPLVVEFVVGRQGWRAGHDRFRHELVVKSCLSGKGADPGNRVVDATAGLGRDSFLLACAGAQVTLMEHQPVLVAMLRDGLNRLARVMPEVAERMTLLEGDATELLVQLDERPDCVLLDPMFPERRKSAAVKKELLLLQYLESAPSSTQEQALLEAAKATGAKRVVVKRPLKAPPLAGCSPAFQRAGKAIRFDVYL